nr:hypothetical protein [uncultured Chryseobacterium sp.]
MLKVFLKFNKKLWIRFFRNFPFEKLIKNGMLISAIHEFKLQQQYGYFDIPEESYR